MMQLQKLMNTIRNKTMSTISETINNNLEKESKEKTVFRLQEMMEWEAKQGQGQLARRSCEVWLVQNQKSKEDILKKQEEDA